MRLHVRGLRAIFFRVCAKGRVARPCPMFAWTHGGHWVDCKAMNRITRYDKALLPVSTMHVMHIKGAESRDKPELTAAEKSMLEAACAHAGMVLAQENCTTSFSRTCRTTPFRSTSWMRLGSPMKLPLGTSILWLQEHHCIHQHSAVKAFRD